MVQELLADRGSSYRISRLHRSRRRSRGQSVDPLLLLSFAILSTCVLFHTASALQLLRPRPTAQNSNNNKNVDLVGLTTHVGAAVSAGVELVEDFDALGHHHGVALLVTSRALRELNVLREAMAEGLETMVRAKLHWSLGVCIVRPIQWAMHVLTSKVFVACLTFGALGAACVEVVEDFSPGGEHGAVLLALNELLELLEHAKLLRGWQLRVLTNTTFRMLLNVGAFAFALYETFETIAHRRLGAHHGVALLSCMKVLRTMGILRSSVEGRSYRNEKEA